MPIMTQATARSMGVPSKTLQTILLSRHAFTLRSAKKWLKDHSYANSYYRTTANEYRFMQTPPIAGARFWSKKISPEILLVFQEY
jgi:hypothetical protein